MHQDFGLAGYCRSMNFALVYSAVETNPSAILKAAAAAPAAPSDQFLQLLPGLNRSSARACHFWPGVQPRTFLRLAAVTLMTGRPILAAASSVIASPCYCFDGRLEPTRRRSEQCDRRASARTAEIEYDDKTFA